MVAAVGVAATEALTLLLGELGESGEATFEGSLVWAGEEGEGVAEAVRDMPVLGGMDPLCD